MAYASNYVEASGTTEGEGEVCSLFVSAGRLAHGMFDQYSAGLPGNGKWCDWIFTYSIKPNTYPCNSPSTHPKRLISLSVSRFFDTSGFDPTKAKNRNSPYVLAQGDATGYGMHADVISAWDGNVLGQAIEQCAQPFPSTHGSKIEQVYVLGTFKDGYAKLCPPFNMQSIRQDDEPYAGLCRKTPTVNEVVKGAALAKLPGCNPVTRGMLSS